MHEIKKFQFIISSKEAKSVGKKGLEKQSQGMLSNFLYELSKAVLNSEDECFIVQMGFGVLDKEELEKLKCH